MTLDTVEERRLVTALFADVSGFTTLAERMDPEDLLEVMDPVLSKMTEVVERYGGQVNKYAGDAVLAFFGAPVAHGDDALRALLAARDMMREVDVLVATMPPAARRLALHIGVNTGHVITGFRGGGVDLDLSLVGDAVNVAQRLEAASPKGEIYVGEATYALTRHALRFEPVGDLAVKGKAETVLAWRLVGGLADAPGHVRMSDIPQGRLVGRQEQVAMVRRELEQVAAGGPRVLALVGEPGVGKSRILEEAERLAAEVGLRWLPTRCVSYGRELAYRPYMELLRNVSGVSLDAPPEVAAVAIAAACAATGIPDAAPYLNQLVGAPVAGEISPAVLGSPEALRLATHQAVITFITVLARASPVVIACEDLHWMDGASFDLTMSLARRCDDLPVAFLITARPEGRALAVELGEAVRGPLIVEDLDRLDRQAVGALVAAMVDAPVADDLVELVADRSAGNALFVREIVSALRDSGGLAPGPAGLTATPGDIGAVLPATIESVLAGRIDNLPRPARDLLQAASVIGRMVPRRLLAALLDARGEALGDGLDSLVEGGFLMESEPGEQYAFTHVLVLEVAYGRLLRRRRRQLHRALVDAGLRVYGTGEAFVELTARHAYLGGMGRDGIAHVRAAARRAASLFANREAIGYLDWAVEMVEGDPAAESDLADLLLEVAALEILAGNFGRALDLYARAGALGAGVAAAVGRSRVLCATGRYREALEALEAGEAAGVNLSPAQRGRVGTARGQALMRMGQLNAAVTELTLAVELLRESGDPGEAEALVLLARNGDAMEAGRDLALAKRAVTLLEAAGDLPRLASALRVLGGNLVDSGDYTGAEPALTRAHEVARLVGHAEEEAAALSNLGELRFQQRRFDEAADCQRRALEVFMRIGLRSGIAAAHSNLAEALVGLERLDEAEAAATEGLSVAEDMGHPYWVTGALLGLGRVALGREDWPAARALAEQVVALDVPYRDRQATARNLLACAERQQRNLPD